MVETRKCFRCQGQKYMFKVNGAYSKLDTGGPKVTCPLCSGEGSIKIKFEQIKEAKKSKNKSKKV